VPASNDDDSPPTTIRFIAAVRDHINQGSNSPHESDLHHTPACGVRVRETGESLPTSATVRAALFFGGFYGKGARNWAWPDGNKLADGDG